VISHSTETVKPIEIAGSNINLSVSADNFWMWGAMAQRAMHSVYTDPKEAAALLSDIMGEMYRAYAFARKDDPSLPSGYRQYLPQ
jgi:hypothetical protein